MDGDTPNRRRYAREHLTVRTVLKAGEDAAWTPYPVVDVSGNGVAIQAEIAEPVGATVAVQIDRIGGARARVVRKGGGVTALEMLDDDADLRGRRVQWHASGARDQRAHQRARPQPKGNARIVAPVTWPDGRVTHAQVLDVSAGGIQLAGLAAAAGTALEVAGVAGRVVRAGEEGAAVAFDDATDMRRLKLMAATPAAPAAGK
ncbi:hypothetical protein [Roseospira goensis]|uniref:PilZ domain-containing protein n=1 Tax=Roseospira goensis TaxID=391922 RepID=A0A7W6S1G6_9PROT|nr:hypothetical protein [Roseospira goensis]MBB4286452.1 hypothetical protein [Roseospira goensis]